jgi:phosphatidylserine decarboxylase precursor-related protein
MSYYIILISVIIIFIILLIILVNNKNNISPNDISPNEIILPNDIIAPCSGKITKITCDGAQHVPTDWSASQTHIGVTLELWDDHRQYFPADGIILSNEIIDGPAYNILRDKSSANKMHITLLATKFGPMTIIRRRGKYFSQIIDDFRVGDNVRRGQYMGKITLGSYCELILPAHFTPNIKLHDEIHAGKTILGKLINK